MKKFLVIALILSISLSIPCVASAQRSDHDGVENCSEDRCAIDDTINETLRKKRDALVEEYLSLPEYEREAFLMEQALPLLMDEMNSIPELKESLTISQQEMDQVTEFLKMMQNDDVA